MYLNKKIFSITLLVFLLGILTTPLLVRAQDKLILSFPPPCIDLPIAGFQLSSCSEPQDIQTYIVRLYQFAVGISGIVAVGMIVYGAIIIIVKSENVTAKSEGKQIIQDALWGVLLLFASFLLLKTINPELVKLKEPATGDIYKLNLEDQGNLNQISSTTCGTANSISGVGDVPIYTNKGGEMAKFNPQNICTYRRLLDLGGMDITDNNTSGGMSGDYYREDEGIEENSIIWTYPYYIKGTNPKDTARCLVYAYRAPNDSGDEKNEVTMIDLNYNVTACILDPLKNDYLSTLPSDDPCRQKYENSSSTPAQCAGWLWGNDPNSIASSSYVTTITPENLESAKQKMEQLKNKSSVSFDGNGTCSPSEKTSPSGIRNDILNKQAPLICDPNCQCSQKNITVSPNLLQKLISLADKTAFIITSLTGGPHSSNSRHYKGIAADIVPKNDSYEDFRDKAEDVFGTNSVLCEAYYDDTSFSKIGQTQGFYVYDSTDSNGKSFKRIVTADGFSQATAACYKESKYHCMSWDNCSSIFFQSGHSGNHLHVQVGEW